MSFEELKKYFDIGHLGKSPSRFDITHLQHWQEEVVRVANDETLWIWLHKETQGLVPLQKQASFLDIVRTNCVFPSQADDWARILFTDELMPTMEIVNVARQAGEMFFLAALDAAITAGDDFNAFMGINAL